MWIAGFEDVRYSTCRCREPVHVETGAGIPDLFEQLDGAATTVYLAPEEHLSERSDTDRGPKELEASSVTLREWELKERGLSEAKRRGPWARCAAKKFEFSGGERKALGPGRKEQAT